MKKLVLAVALAAFAGIAAAQAQTWPLRPVTLIVPFPPGGSTDTAVRARFTDLGLDIASREQQTPEGLAAFHKGEIEKWWPIIEAAGIKVE